MIGVIFTFASEIVEVRVENTNVFFRNSKNPGFADISGIKLDKQGTIKEFPDLKDKEDWKKQASERFKAKIKQLPNEKDRIQYIIEDLSKHGYTPKYIQKKGHRPVKL